MVVVMTGCSERSVVLYAEVLCVVKVLLFAVSARLFHVCDVTDAFFALPRLGLAMSLSSVADASPAGSRSHESTDEVPDIAVDVAENPWPLVSLGGEVSAGSSVSVLIHPRRVRVYLDQEMFNRHSGLPGVKAMQLWSRWFLEHHDRGTLCGDEETPKIEVLLPIGARGPVSESRPCAWVFFDLELLSRASGLCGRPLMSAWCTWWTLAEVRGEIWGGGTTIGLQLEDLTLDP